MEEGDKKEEVKRNRKEQGMQKEKGKRGKEMEENNYEEGVGKER